MSSGSIQHRENIKAKKCRTIRLFPQSIVVVLQALVYPEIPVPSREQLDGR